MPWNARSVWSAPDCSALFRSPAPPEGLPSIQEHETHINAGAAVRWHIRSSHPRHRRRPCHMQWARSRPPNWRQTWKTSSPTAWNHSADTGCLSNHWTAPAPRCPARTSHNEIRKSAWPKNNALGENLKRPDRLRKASGASISLSKTVFRASGFAIRLGSGRPRQAQFYLPG